jgi:hypothetical protein
VGIQAEKGGQLARQGVNRDCHKRQDAAIKGYSGSKTGKKCE